MSRTRRLTVAMTGVLAIAACSLTDDEQTAADSIASALVSKQSPESARDSADCVAEKWVGEVGTEPLVDDGLLNDRFKARSEVVREVADGRQPVSDDVAEGYAAAWLACADFDAISLDEQEARPSTSDEDLDDYADCLKEIDDDMWRDAIADRLTGDESSSASVGLRRELSDCRSVLDQPGR